MLTDVVARRQGLWLLVDGEHEAGREGNDPPIRDLRANHALDGVLALQNATLVPPAAAEVNRGLVRSGRALGRGGRVEEEVRAYLLLNLDPGLVVGLVRVQNGAEANVVDALGVLLEVGRGHRSEVGVGLAIVLLLYRNQTSIDVEDFDLMKG